MSPPTLDRRGPDGTEEAEGIEGTGGGGSSLVLAYESPVPPHGGYRLRILHLARTLTSLGPVEVAALGEVGDASDEPFSLVGVPHAPSRARALLRSVRRPYLEGLHASPGLAAEARRSHPDVVQISSPFFLDAARATGAPVLFDAHNVEAHIMATLAATEPRRLHRARWAAEARKLERAERRVAVEVDAIVTTSELDAATFRSWGARRVEVVPNGVDTAAMPYRPVGPGTTIVYLGQFSYRPNERAAIELIDDVLPLVRRRVPDAGVELVGRNPGEALRRRVGPGVDVVGAVPDVRPHLHGARVLAVPLRAGSGTRLKILEAMAAGVPVVSTPLGAAGIEARPGEELLIGEGPEELADHVAAVLEDDVLAERLSRNARAFVEARYDWSVLVPPLLALHQELRAERAAR